MKSEHLDWLAWFRRPRWPSLSSRLKHSREREDWGSGEKKVNNIRKWHISLGGMCVWGLDLRKCACHYFIWIPISKRTDNIPTVNRSVFKLWWYLLWKSEDSRRQVSCLTRHQLPSPLLHWEIWLREPTATTWTLKVKDRFLFSCRSALWGNILSRMLKPTCRCQY